LNRVNLDVTPQLMNLKVGEETHSDVMRIIPEDMLLRWFNYHLNNAGHDHHIFNYTDDVKDSIKYTELLNQLNSECDKAAIDETDLPKRAEFVLANSAKLNVPALLGPEDIVNVN
jgi:plastin-1